MSNPIPIVDELGRPCRTFTNKLEMEEQADEIRRYWEARGIEISVWIDTIQRAKENVHCIRSNLGKLMGKANG